MVRYDLAIRFGFGQIGIKTYQGDLGIKTDKSGGFALEIKQPELSLAITHPEMAIDLSQCRAAMGYYSPVGFGAVRAGEGMHAALGGIERRAQEGDALGAIERQISIGEVAASAAFPEGAPTGGNLVPAARPSIRAVAGKVAGKFIPGDVKVIANPAPVRFEVKRASVEIGLERNPYIEIKAVPAGKQVDLAV